MYQLIDAFSEHEREIIRSRVKSDMAAAKRLGVHVDRKPVSMDAAEVARLRESGLSVAAVAQQLGTGVSTAHRNMHLAQDKAKGCRRGDMTGTGSQSGKPE